MIYCGNVYLVLLEGFKQNYKKENMYREHIYADELSFKRTTGQYQFPPGWKPQQSHLRCMSLPSCCFLLRVIHDKRFTNGSPTVLKIFCREIRTWISFSFLLLHANYFHQRINSYIIQDGMHTDAVYFASLTVL